MQVWESETTDSSPTRFDAEYLFAIIPEDETRATVWWTDSSSMPGSAATRRTLDLHAQHVGPAAPDVACRDRLHDPFEDFVSITFPRFDGRAREAGDSWTGSPVLGDSSSCRAPDSCCAALACGSPQPRDTAPDARPSCDLGSWRESIRGYGSGLNLDLAELASDWWIGPKVAPLARASRFTDFDPISGRVIRVHFESEIAASARHRHVEIVALDACGGIQPLASDPASRERLARLSSHGPATP
jgi:hypothetical protein